MNSNQELTRLATVIRHSKKAAELRAMMQLQNEESIIQFENEQTIVHTTKGKRETRNISDEQPDMLFYEKEVEPLVRKNIIEYFQIDLPEETVFQKLFCQPSDAPTGVLVRTRLNRRGHFEVVFEFETMPNNRTASLLCKELEERITLIQQTTAHEEWRKAKLERLNREDKALDSIPEHMAQEIRKIRAGKNDQLNGETELYKNVSEPRFISMEDSMKERLKAPQPFDEKYEIALAYKNIQKNRPEMERADAVKNLNGMWIRQ